MAAGFRNLPAIPLGIEAPPVVPAGSGVRSLLAFWMGGASGVSQAGYPSLIAFWLGGGGSGAIVPPVGAEFPYMMHRRRRRIDEFIP